MVEMLIRLSVFPLTRLGPDAPPMSHLNAGFEIHGATLILDPLHIASFDAGELCRPVANLSADAQAVWDALDYALQGY